MSDKHTSVRCTELSLSSSFLTFTTNELHALLSKDKIRKYKKQ